LKKTLKIQASLIMIVAAMLILSACRPFEIMRDRATVPETTVQEPAETTTTTEAQVVETTQQKEQQVSYPRSLEETRDYFTKGVSFFEEGQYVEAQYYLSKLLNSYPLLRDYVLYYMAKSTLLENKFAVAEGYYDQVMEEHTESIWYEKARLEIGDLYYIKGDYVRAQEHYKSFIRDFSQSSDLVYALMQYGFCLDKNADRQGAYDVYLDIYINHPASSYASGALSGLERIAREMGEDAFTLSSEQIYTRGNNFFSLYRYSDALTEFRKILDSPLYDAASDDLKARTIFRTGMCYYNMRDYATARDTLRRSYESFPAGRLAADSLYFLGRALTNTGENEEAVDTYLHLLERFPASNLADDSLYRIGRIYFSQQDQEKAMQYFQTAVEKYPQSDILSDLYWELGWMQYSLGRYNESLNTFDLMSQKFKGQALEEVSLFWKAKSMERIGKTNESAEAYQRIAQVNPYSYYGFRSMETLKSLGISVDLPRFNQELSPLNPDIRDVLPDIYDLVDIEKDNQNLPQKKHVSKAKELIFLGFDALASSEISASEKEFEQDPAKILEISTLYLSANDYGKSIGIVRRNYTRLLTNLTGPEKDYFFYLAYPFAYRDPITAFSAQYAVDPLFLLAIIREESNFRQDAGSHAGALGLMQVMPATGADIASQIGIQDYSPDILLDPETSIMMGSYYIRKMLDTFDGNMFYALGAYNGGPGAMQSWIRRFGDLDIDEFVESVTYNETRGYIKRVTGTYHVYKMLYD
jgi:soluble lytic murein transglycosylase